MSHAVLDRRERHSGVAELRHPARFETCATLEGSGFGASPSCQPPRSATSPPCAGWPSQFIETYVIGAELGNPDSVL